MKGSSRKFVAVWTCIAMLVGATGVFTAFGASGDYTVLDCNNKNSINAVGNMSADEKTVYGSKYSASWACKDAENITFNIPKDITPYTELHFWANVSQDATLYLRLDSENSATDGSDYYGDKITLKQGWQEFSIDIGKLTVSRTPRGYNDVSNLQFHATGWSMTNNTDTLVVKFDTITLKNNPSYTKLQKGVPIVKPPADPNAPVGNEIFYNRTYDESNMNLNDSIGSPVAKTNKIELASDSDENKYVKMTKLEGSSDDCFFDVRFVCNATRIVAEVDLTFDDALKPFNIQYRDKDNKQSTLMSVSADGNATVADQTVTKIKKGVWSKFAFAINLVSKTGDVYLGGKKMLTDVSYGGSAVDTISLIRIYMDSSDPKTGVSFDNFRIYEGKQPRDLGGKLPAAAATAPPKPADAPVYSTPSPIPVEQLFGSGVALMVDHREAYANKKMTQVDANNEKVVPTVIDGRTLVPVRFIAENFGATVSWDENAQSVGVNTAGRNIGVVIGAKEMTIDGQSIAIDVPAQTIYDRTMLPLRAVAEAIGKNVFWDDRGLILITDKSKAIDAVKDSRVVDGMISLIQYGSIDTRYNQSPRFTQWLIDDAVDTALVKFTGSRTSSNVGWGDLEQKSSKAMYYLTLAEYFGLDAVSSKTGQRGKDRVVQQLRELIKGGNEPFACAGPYLAHSEISSVLLLAKNTPSIWSEFSSEEVEKFDWLMRGLAICGNWAYNDANNYKTGFDLTGNFDKGWNPNYKNTYLSVVGNACLYFGGADALNDIFAKFDYDQYIEKYEQFGFTNILQSWTVAGKDLMEKGGPATLTAEYGGVGAGTGAGVRVPFKYKGYGLDQLDKIAETHIQATYDSVVVDFAGKPGTNEYAYIVSGKSSPFLGYRGMMYEFVSGDAGGLRSSASYCYASQVTLMPYITNLTLFHVWDGSKSDSHNEINKMVYVGNEDLIFKLEQGYHSFRKGVSAGDEYEATFVNLGYAMDKEIWRKVLQFSGEELTISKVKSNVAQIAPKDGIASAPEGSLTGIKYGTAVPPEAFIPLGDKLGNAITVDFDLNLDNEVDPSFDGVIGFVKDKAEDITYPKMNALIQLKSETINVMNATAYKNSAAMVGANYKYHIQVVLNAKNGTYSVYVTPTYPKSGEVTCIAKDYKFRESAGTVDGIKYMVLVRAVDTGNYWIENLSVKLLIP